jgi:hypothetical protein
MIFELISKAYAIRLTPLSHQIIFSAQTTFIKGKYIHVRALALHGIKIKESIGNYSKA